MRQPSGSHSSLPAFAAGQPGMCMLADVQHLLAGMLGHNVDTASAGHGCYQLNRIVQSGGFVPEHGCRQLTCRANPQLRNTQPLHSIPTSTPAPRCTQLMHGSRVQPRHTRASWMDGLQGSSKLELPDQRQAGRQALLKAGQPG